MAQSDKYMMGRVCQKKLLPGNWPKGYSLSLVNSSLFPNTTIFPKKRKKGKENNNAKKGGMAEMPVDGQSKEPSSLKVDRYRGKRYIEDLQF